MFRWTGVYGLAWGIWLILVGLIVSNVLICWFLLRCSASWSLAFLVVVVVDLKGERNLRPCSDGVSHSDRILNPSWWGLILIVVEKKSSWCCSKLWMNSRGSCFRRSYQQIQCSFLFGKKVGWWWWRWLIWVMQQLILSVNVKLSVMITWWSILSFGFDVWGWETAERTNNTTFTFFGCDFRCNGVSCFKNRKVILRVSLLIENFAFRELAWVSSEMRLRVRG